MQVGRISSCVCYIYDYYFVTIMYCKSDLNTEPQILIHMIYLTFDFNQIYVAILQVKDPLYWSINYATPRIRRFPTIDMQVS